MKPLNESSINKREELLVSHRHDHRRRNGTNRCIQNPIVFHPGRFFRRDVETECLSDLSRPYIGFSPKTTNSRFCSSLLRQFLALSLSLSPLHCPLFSERVSAIACVSRTFRSLSIPHFHPLVHPLSLCSCFRVHFVTRQPHDRTSDLRGLIKLAHSTRTLDTCTSMCA